MFVESLKKSDAVRRIESYASLACPGWNGFANVNRLGKCTGPVCGGYGLVSLKIAQVIDEINSCSNELLWRQVLRLLMEKSRNDTRGKVLLVERIVGWRVLH
jgi:hypothetical protein